MSCARAVPIITCVAEKFEQFPDPRGGIGRDNVGLAVLPETGTPVTEYLALIVSAKLLDQVGTHAWYALICAGSCGEIMHLLSGPVWPQGDPWCTALGVEKWVAEGKVQVLGPDNDVELVCKEIAEQIKSSPQVRSLRTSLLTRYQGAVGLSHKPVAIPQFSAWVACLQCHDVITS